MDWKEMGGRVFDSIFSSSLMLKNYGRQRIQLEIFESHAV
jgi:hypothetical protein